MVVVRISMTVPGKMRKHILGRVEEVAPQLVSGEDHRFAVLNEVNEVVVLSVVEVLNVELNEVLDRGRHSVKTLRREKISRHFLIRRQKRNRLEKFR